MKIVAIIFTFLTLMSLEVNAQKEIWSTFGEHTKSQFTYNPISFGGFTNAYPGKVNVDASGDFNFSVPLMTISGRRLSYPLSLTYTPGIKVTQEASWVGLGWNFSDSFVERQVIGPTDDNVPTLKINTGGQDLFHIKLPDGRSGTIIQHDPDDVNEDYMIFKMSDGTGWKIKYTDNSFIITDENGVSYVFADAMFGYTYDQGWLKIACTNNGSPVSRSVIPSLNEPFVKWHLTAILHSNYKDNDLTSGADEYDPLDNNAQNQPIGSWIRVVNRLSDSEVKDWRYYTTREMANTDLDGCSSNNGESAPAHWTPSRLFELTYPKYIITPTHIAEFETEEEPTNPISELMEDKYGVFGEFNRQPTWQYYNVFYNNDTIKSEKNRRLTSIRIYTNELDPVFSLPGTLTDPFVEINFEYYSLGENFWGSANTSFYEERSLLKATKIIGANEPLEYKFKYHNVLNSADVQTVSINGNNRKILKCYTSSVQNKGCDYYSTYQNSSSNYDDLSSPLKNYYRGAFNAATNSSIGPDGYLNRNTVLQNEFDNSTFDYSSLEDDAAMWSLSQVTFPNGSKQEFEYQTDRYIVDFYHRGKDIESFNNPFTGQNIVFSPTTSLINWGFGIRLKSQKLFGGDAGTKTYSYEYASLDEHSNPGSETWWDGVVNGGLITEGVGRIYGDPIEITAPNNCNDSLDGFQCRQHILPPTDYLSNQTTRKVIYGRITENHPDGSSIISYFDVPNLEKDRQPVPGSDADKFEEIMGNRGLLYKKEYYNSNDQHVSSTLIETDEKLQSDVIDQMSHRVFTFWKESETQSQTYHYSNQNVVSTSKKVYDEESGLVLRSEVDHPVNSNDKRITKNIYKFKTVNDFKDRNLLTSKDESHLIEKISGTESVIFKTKFNYDSYERITSVISGYNSPEEIYNFKDGLYDAESNLYQFTDANLVDVSIHYTTKSKIPTAVFANADYSKTFIDDFEDSNYSNIYRSDGSNLPWQVSSGSWHVLNGRLKGSNNGIIYNDLLSTMDNGDQIIEFDIYPNEQSYQGGINSEFRFRVNSSKTNFYKLVIKNTISGTKDVRLYKNSTLKNTASLSLVVEDYLDPINTRITLDNDDILVVVNGAKVIEYNDPSIYSDGGIGFKPIYLGQKFDNVRIYPINANAANQVFEDKTLKLSEIANTKGVKVFTSYDNFGRELFSFDRKQELIGQNSHSVLLGKNAGINYTNDHPIRKNNLIGYWKFDNSITGVESSFNHLESEALQFNGSSTAIPIYGEGMNYSSHYSSSDEFTADAALINNGDIDEFDSPSEFTFSGWFKRDAHAHYMVGQPSLVTPEGIHNVLIANSSDDVNQSNNFLLGTNGSNVEIYLNTVTGGAGKESFDAGIQDDIWYHIALVYDGGETTNTTKLYINGDFVKKWDATGGYWYDNLVFSGTSSLTFGGANPTNPDGLFNGLIDDFIIFNEALSDEQISNLTGGVVGNIELRTDLGEKKAEIKFGRSQGDFNVPELKVDNTYDLKGRKITTSRANSSDVITYDYFDDPLNRLKETKLPGTGAEIGVNNTSTLLYDSNNSLETFSSFENYSAGMLHKTITKDPNGNQLIEYTNRVGQTIASVVDMDKNGIKSGGDLISEFGYDNKGNLIKSKDPRNLVTEYEYDNFSRLSRKKIPDQDDWVDYKYDDNGNVRFVELPEHKLTGSSSSHSLQSWSGTPITKNLTASKAGLLKFTFDIVDLFFSGYDFKIKDNNNGDVSIFNHSIPGDIYGLEKSLTVTAGSYELSGKSQDPQDQYHVTDGTYSFTPYKYSYTKYDNLNRITESGEYYGSTSFSAVDPNNKSFPSSDKRTLVEYKYGSTFGYNGAKYLAGNVSQIKYYNPNDFNQGPSKIYYSYNDDGLTEWIVHEIVKNDGSTLSKRVEYEYDNIGRLIEIRFNPGGSDSFYQRYTYDPLSRIVKAETSLTGQSSEWLTAAEYSYDNEGNLTVLKLGENAQIIDYEYDKRGWITAINESNTVGSGPQEDRFFQKINYFDSSVPVSKRRFNGDIAQQTWGYDTRLINKPDQSYLYTYDNANRLDFADRFGSGYVSGAFDVDPTYDKNGNITAMVRKNETGSTSSGSHFGNFFMVHSGSSNRINYVEDAINQITYDIDYDANGNLIKNEKHNLKKTSYDLDNMALRSIVGSNVIQYRYDQSGQRISKSVIGGSGSIYIRGAGGKTLAVYDENGTLLFHNIIVGSQVIGKAN